MWCVLGTLGNFLTEAARSEASLLLLRFRFSVPDLGLAVEAGTDWPADISLEPLSDLEGLEEEHRRCWLRRKTGMALGAEEARAEMTPV
jgi:hypothetical protein